MKPAVWILTCLLVASPPIAAAPPAAQFFAQHCVSCHGTNESNGDVRLDRLPDEWSAMQELLEKVMIVLEEGAMPPDDQPQPERAAVVTALQSIEAMLAADRPEAGLKRLTRSEYTNAINDLFQVDFDLTELLPPDHVQRGFDKFGEVHLMSPHQVRAHLTTARYVADRLLLDRKPEQLTWNFDARHFHGSGRGDYGTDEGFFLSTNYPWRGNLHFSTAAEGYERFMIPQFGRYRFEVGVEAIQTDDDQVVGINLGDPRYPTNFRKLRRVSLPHGAPDFEVELTLNQGDEVAFTFDSAKIWRIDSSPKAYDGPKLRFTRVQVTGPIHDRWPTYSATAILPRPDMTPDTLVDHLVTRLTNRSLNDEDRGGLVAFAEAQARSGASQTSVARSVLTALLASPHFIYKAESPHLSDIELAYRLSFFLWNSVPDADLLDAAQSGTFREQLDSEVQRMLGDPKAGRFVRDFTTQWLQLDQVNDVAPDERVFPDVTPLHVASMAEEPVALFRHILENDLSIAEFIDSDFIMVNDQLADFYGLPAVQGSEFRPVMLPADNQRGGLVGQAAFLKLTSSAFASSPIHRGVWILNNLYGDKMEPPSDLKIEEPDIRGTTTVKEVLERHQQSNNCNRCHSRIDPLGFALEYYDPVGRPRNEYRMVEVVSKEKITIKTHPIEAEMALADGRVVKDMPSLKRVLMEDRERIVKGIIGKLISYGIGREVTVRDRAFINDVYERTAAADHSLRAAIVAIVTHSSFGRN
jgi:hypothetical protein